MFNEYLLSYDAFFFKAMYPISNFYVYLPIWSNAVNWVFFLDLISDVFNGYFHIPVGGHGIVEVDVFNIRSAEFGSSLRVRDEFIQHYLCLGVRLPGSWGHIHIPICHLRLSIVCTTSSS